nr:hypothetical protein CFP56_64454 [Quercus suber]
MKLSWPLSTREAVVHYFLFEYFQDDLIVVLLNTISDSEDIDMAIHGFTSEAIPEAEDVIRIDVEGGYALQKCLSKTIEMINDAWDLMEPYLWSEYYNLSSLLSQEGKFGFLKSFDCYSPEASGDPFCCCISVRNISLHSSSQSRKSASLHEGTLKKSFESCGQILRNLDESMKRFVHQLTLTTLLVVSNYLPESVSLTIESGGVTHIAILSEVETSFHHIDPSYDLGSGNPYARIETIRFEVPSY